ncbi:MAG: Smr/MutS family protein, partial [Oligoflexales bacterium]|nr:Smr/MutS family protein [Oligoflexales bacterium]
IERAAELKGETGSSLDRLIESLNTAIEEAGTEKINMQNERIKMEAQKAHWEREKNLLAESRSRVAKNMAEKLESDTHDLRERIEQHIGELKRLIAKSEKEGVADTSKARSEMKNIKDSINVTFEKLNGSVMKLRSDMSSGEPLPGEPASICSLCRGDKVYVIPLGREAVVVNISPELSDGVEVQAGLMKIRLKPDEIRLLGKGSPKSRHPAKPSSGKRPQCGGKPDPHIKSVIPTSGNTIDVRGKNADAALEKVWSFLDKALLRGESLIIVIHGHGTDTLKKIIRNELERDPPYNLSFRPGEASEGGDGVTVVKLEG